MRKFQFSLQTLIAGTLTFAGLMALNCIPHPGESVGAYKWAQRSDGGGDEISKSNLAWGWPVRAISRSPTYHGPVTDVRYLALVLDAAIVIFVTGYVIVWVHRRTRSESV